MYAFHDILERNETLWDYKNKKLKKREIRIFPKGIVHVFGQKFETFPSFYSTQNRPEKYVPRYSRRGKRSL